MKLRNAIICLNCDEVFVRETARSARFIYDQWIDGCPSCGSEATWPLAKWIMALDAQKKGQAPHTDTAPHERILL